LRRLDSRIAPLVMILYLIAFLDRSELLLESDRLFAILMNRASISFHYRQHRYA
jgi:hypothetical protein